MDTKHIKLHEEVHKALADLGFTEFTEIQEKAIPIIQQGHDVIGQSFTGSGKTVAFGIPALEKINLGHGLQLLIMVPTRELCNQVAKEMHKFSKYKRARIVEVYGGVSINPQIDQLESANIVVGTPGRMLDHLQRGTIDLSKVKILVLDEADKMFEMGFVDDVKQIISQIPADRQTLLFSATMSDQVMEIVEGYMRSPQKVKVQEYVDSSQLEQVYYEIHPNDKFSLLVHFLKKNTSGLSIVFCSTRHMVDILGRNLSKQNIIAEPLHGGLSQNKRKMVMDMFHAKKLDVLIASDVAARGLDIKDVGLVVNYDIPKTSKEYVHRIGRTARAGASGMVISLLIPRDHDNFRHVLEDHSLNIQRMDVPPFQKVFMQMSTSRSGGGRFQERGQGRGGPSRGGGPRGSFPRRRYNS